MSLGDFPERPNHSWSGKNTSFGSSQWTKADPMLKTQTKFPVGKPEISRDHLEGKEQNLQKHI